MQIVKEELTEAGLTIIIKGKMNPAVACKLLPGGYSFMFEPDGMVKITLKLKDAEAPAQPSAVEVDGKPQVVKPVKKKAVKRGKK